MSEPTVLESNQNHATITDNGISPTLSVSMGLGGGYVPMITEKVYTASGESFFTEAHEDVACVLMARDYKDPPIVTSSKSQFFTETSEDITYTLVGTDYKDPPIIVEEK